MDSDLRSLILETNPKMQKPTDREESEKLIRLSHKSLETGEIALMR